jgi:hypothetical protein
MSHWQRFPGGRAGLLKQGTRLFELTACHLTLPLCGHIVARYDEQSLRDMPFGPNRDLCTRSTFTRGQSQKCSAKDCCGRNLRNAGGMDSRL